MTLRKLILATLLATPLFASADLVSNGGFEASTPSAGWSSSATTGFAPISVYGPCCSPYGSYTAGSNAAFFGWGDMPGGEIWQDLATVAGTQYVVNFAYGAIAAATSQSLLASALSGASFTTVLGSANASATGTSNLAAILSGYSFTFTADSSVTRLMFKDTSLSTGSVDGVLDSVSVTAAVPEPETYALMLAGLGAVGFMARRRKMN